MRVRPALAGILLALTASLPASCSGARPGVSNGSVTVCYRAIPTARAAVHSPGATLVGVHRLTADQLRRRLPEDGRAQIEAENDTSVCAVTFRGDFASGQVDQAPPGRSGRYAIVVVSSRRLQVLTSIVLDSVPPGLGRRTL